MALARLKVVVADPGAEHVLVRFYMGPPEGEGELAEVGHLIPSPAEWEELRDVLTFGANINQRYLAFELVEPKEAPAT